MSWVTRTRRTMDDERELPAEMLQMVQVKILHSFVFEDLEAKAGDVLTLPRHRASYLRFRQLVEWA